MAGCIMRVSALVFASVQSMPCKLPSGAENGTRRTICLLQYSKLHPDTEMLDPFVISFLSENA